MRAESTQARKTGILNITEVNERPRHLTVVFALFLLVSLQGFTAFTDIINLSVFPWGRLFPLYLGADINYSNLLIKEFYKFICYQQQSFCCSQNKLHLKSWT